MNCSNCQAPLEDSTSGFIVCKQCGTVNISHGQGQPSIGPAADTNFITETPLAPSDLSSATSFSWWPPRFSYLMIGAAVVVLTSVGVIGFLFYGNGQAKQLYSQAEQQIHGGHYQKANTLLLKAKSDFAFPVTHKQIVALINANKRWLADATLLQQANALYKEGDYASAAGLLDEIDPSFPGYHAVKTLLGRIKQHGIDTGTQYADGTVAVDNTGSDSGSGDVVIPPTASDDNSAGSGNSDTTGPASSDTTTTTPTPTPTPTPPPPPPPGPITVAGTGSPTVDADGYHYRAVGYDRNSMSSNTGASVNIGQADPYVAPKDHSSSAELEVAAGSGAGLNGVEVGWRVLASSPKSPQLFVHYYLNGKSACYNSGCGWVQVSGTVIPGHNVSSGVNAGYKIQYAASTNRWIVYYNGAQVGYYPESIWSGKYVQALWARVFGEVLASSNNTCTDMGNGQLGNASSSAAISGFQLLGTTNPSVLTVQVTAPYNAGFVKPTSFNFGGPGNC